VLDVGEPRAGPLIRAVLGCIGREVLTFVDAPPGTSCAVTAALTDADRALLVTEPTPIGLHDLELAVDLCRAYDVPPAVLLNRSDVGDARPVREYLRSAQVPILAEWRYDPAIATACARGELAGRSVPWLRASVERLLDACLAWPERGCA
jgi:MinD superfamily P-loop ATPase